jgi:hypothetical protein
MQCALSAVCRAFQPFITFLHHMHLLLLSTYPQCMHCIGQKAARLPDGGLSTIHVKMSRFLRIWNPVTGLYQLGTSSPRLPGPGRNHRAVGTSCLLGFVIMLFSSVPVLTAVLAQTGGYGIIIYERQRRVSLACMSSTKALPGHVCEW